MPRINEKFSEKIYFAASRRNIKTNVNKRRKMKKNCYLKVMFFLLLGITQISYGQNSSTSLSGCRFNLQTLSFNGTSLEQTKCLLRKVKMGAAAFENQSLPNFLEQNVDRDIQIKKVDLRKYLAANNIPENEIGGSLDDPLSRANDNNSSMPFAQYFVIHDTSTPNLKTARTFPTDINDSAWTYNSLSKYANSENAHLYITRDGKSVAPQSRTFKTPYRATKLENPHVKTKGLFLHIENIQPRRCRDNLINTNRCMTRNSKGKEVWNDSVAPQIGFSDKQLQRLALVYIAASIRKGKWLIPAFHANLDDGIGGGHDDPQNFDLQKWSDELSNLVGKINDLAVN